MAAKTPVKATFTGSDVTGLGEFVSGDFIDYGIGGTGLTSLGSAGQVLKVNSGGTALEYGSVEAILNIDGMTDGSGITIADSDKFAISDGGTEKYIEASQITTYVQSNISGITIVDDSSTSATISPGETLKITGGTNITSTLSGDTITLAISSGIDATNIADGSISNTEFQYLNGVSSNIQTQLDAKASTAFAIAQAVALG